MFRLLGLGIFCLFIGACQPPTDLQTAAPQPEVPVAATATENDVIWQGGAIINSEGEGTTAMSPLQPDETNSDPETVMVVEGNLATEATQLDPANPSEDLATDAKTVDTMQEVLAAIQETLESQTTKIEIPKAEQLLHPEGMVGLNMVELGRSLGLPNFERSDADVMIWQYRLAACVTDFFLYLDGEDYVVTAWAWRSPEVGAGLNTDQCARQLGKLMADNA